MQSNDLVKELCQMDQIKRIGPITLNRLLERFKGDPWKVLSASAQDLVSVKGVGNQIVETLLNNNASEWLKKEKENLFKMGGHFLGREQFPEFFRFIEDNKEIQYKLK